MALDYFDKVATIVTGSIRDTLREARAAAREDAGPPGGPAAPAETPGARSSRCCPHPRLVCAVDVDEFEHPPGLIPLHCTGGSE